MDENMFAMLTFLAIMVVLGGIYFLYRYLKNRKPAPTGRGGGADKLAGTVRGFSRANGFRFIGPGVFESVKGGHTGALDAVVVGYFGILGVKALGYNGEIYGAAADAEWLQVTPSGERRNFSNPVTEASADMRVLRDVLLAAKLRQVPVEIVCVFTAKQAQLALPKNTGHLTAKEFKALLQKDKYLEDKGLDLDKVSAALEAAHKTEDV